MDLNASSSSMQSIPSARTPHKVETQGSADSNEGYTPSYSNQMMSTDQQGRAFANFQPSGHPAAVPPHQWAQSPPQAAGPMQHQPFRQNLQQQGIGGGHQQQQFTGSPQGGHMIPPHPGERARPSSGPIPFPNLGQVAEDQREGLWMGAHQPQPQQQPQQQQRAQKSNSGRPLQINPQPGYGNQGKSRKGVLYIPLVYVVWFCFLWLGALPVQSASQGDLFVEDLEAPCGQPTTPQPQLVTNVHVQNIPPAFRNIGLKYYLEKLMQNEVTCTVEQFSADAVAVFQPAIGN